ncbi:MAG: response regulator [Nitrospinae bacterium]|nr:response regulator [Nitrospinota bacterium]
MNSISVSQENKKILVVDDHPLTREMLTFILEAEGYSVDTDENGVKGLQKVKEDNDYSLIITDLEMPEMGGLEFIGEINRENIGLPVIVLSGNNDVTKALKALEIGAYEYVLKDENIENTTSLAVKRVFEKHELKQKNLDLIQKVEIKNKELEVTNLLLKNAIQNLSESGSAISSEKNLLKLLEMIVGKARELTSADGGTLYILEEDGMLHFKIVQSASMNIFLGGTSGDQITFPPVALEKSNVSAFAAIEKKIINIPDVYQNESFDFSGPKNFDKSTGYKTKSMLVLPMVNRDNKVIGVLQLINSKVSYEGMEEEIVSFTKYHEEISNSFACQAAVCLENVINLEKINAKNIAFKRFVPMEFIGMLGKSEVEEVNLGQTTDSEMAVLFSDIRSFTKLSESMKPNETIKFLNH